LADHRQPLGGDNPVFPIHLAEVRHSAMSSVPKGDRLMSNKQFRRLNLDRYIMALRFEDLALSHPDHPFLRDREARIQRMIKRARNRQPLFEPDGADLS